MHTSFKVYKTATDQTGSTKVTNISATSSATVVSKVCWYQWEPTTAQMLPISSIFALYAGSLGFCVASACGLVGSLGCVFLFNSLTSPSLPLSTLSSSLSWHINTKKMTVKRRNHGRNKHGRGHVKRVRWAFVGICNWAVKLATGPIHWLISLSLLAVRTHPFFFFVPNQKHYTFVVWRNMWWLKRKQMCIHW